MSSFRRDFSSITLWTLTVFVNQAFVALLFLLLAEPKAATAMKLLNPDDIAPAKPHASGELSTSSTGALYPWRPPVVNINYFGGPVLSNPIKLYFIWYGNWSESHKRVVRTAVNSITPPHPVKEFPNIGNWWKIVAQYRESPPHGPAVSSSVSIDGETDDFYSRGKNLTFLDNTLRDIIFTAINTRKLPTDHLNGIYIIFTDGEVRFSEFAGCGFHNQSCFDLKNNASCGRASHNILWSWISNPSAASGLSPYCNLFRFIGGYQNDLPPNYLVDPTGSLDSTVDFLFHEVAEAATDPYFPHSWIFNQSSNSENGDLCALVFGEGGRDYCGLSDVYGFNHSQPGVCSNLGSVPKDPKSGAIYNLHGIDGSRFLIQQMWSLANKGCQLQLQEPCKSEPVFLSTSKGKIRKGVFVHGLGLQRYAPGENCKWIIAVPKARSITLHFKALGTGFDDLDRLDVFDQNQQLQFTISAESINGVLSFKVRGSEATITFTSYGGRSPYPVSTGFEIDYVADY